MYTQTQVLDESFLDVPGSVITRVKVGILRSCDQDYEVFTGENCVGRSDVCDIVLKAPSVSGKHAIIEAEDFESLSIYDCNSRNKTILGKVKLKPNIRYNIQDGDEITFGDFVVTYIKVTESHASVNDDSSSDTGSESMFYNTLVPDTPVGREITHEKMPGIVVAESPNTSIESEITGIEDKDIFASFCNLETPKVYRNINEKHFLEKQNLSKCLNENEGLSRTRTQMSDKFFTEFESRIIISKPKVQEVDNSSDDEIIPATQGKLGNNESFSDSKVIKEAEIQHDGTGLPTSEAISEILSFSEECLSSKETQNSAHTSKQEVVDNSAAKSDILEGKKGSSKISKLFSWQKNIDFNLKQSSEQTEIEECNKSSDPEGLTQVNLKINYTEDEKTGGNKSDQSNSCKVEEECNKSLSNPEGLTQVNLKINNTEDEKTEGNKSDQSNSCKVEEERNKSVCDPEDLTQVNFKINNTEGEKTGENISEQSSSCKFEEYNKNIIDPEVLIQVNLKTSNTEGEKTGVNKSEQNNSCRVEEEHKKNTIDSEALTQVNFKINSTEDEKTGGNKSEQSNSCRVEEEYNKSVIEPEGLTQMNLKINSAKIEKIGINKSEQSNSCIVEDHNKTIADPLLVQLNMNTQVPITGTDKFNNVDTISQDPVFNMNTQVLITDTFKFNNAGTISHDPVFNMNTQVLITSTDKFNSADTISQDAVFNMDTQIQITDTNKFNSADIVSQDPTFNMNTQVPITDTEKFNIADTVSQDPIFNMVTQVPVLDSVNTSEASEDSKFSVDTQIPIQDIKDINIHFLNDFNKIKLSKIIEPKKKQQVNTSVVNASLSSSSSQETKYIPEVCIQKNNVLNSFENVIFKQCSKNKCEVQFGDNNIVTNSGTGKVLAQTDVNSKNVNGINHGNNKVEDSCVTETLTQVSLQKENRTDINIEDLDDDSTDIDEDLAKNKSLPVVTLKTSEVSVNTIYLSEENNQSESLKIVSEGIDENAEEENIFDGTKSIICKHSPCKASKKGNDSTKHSESGTSFSLAHSSNNNGNKDETEFSLASTCAFEEAVIPFEATYTLRKDASYSDEETEIKDKDKTVNSSQVGKSRLSKSTKKVSECLESTIQSMFENNISNRKITKDFEKAKEVIKFADQNKTPLLKLKQIPPQEIKFSKNNSASKNKIVIQKNDVINLKNEQKEKNQTIGCDAENEINLNMSDANLLKPEETDVLEKTSVDEKQDYNKGIEPKACTKQMTPVKKFVGDSKHHIAISTVKKFKNVNENISGVNNSTITKTIPSNSDFITSGIPEKEELNIKKSLRSTRSKAEGNCAIPKETINKEANKSRRQIEKLNNILEKDTLKTKCNAAEDENHCSDKKKNILEAEDDDNKVSPSKKPKKSVRRKNNNTKVCDNGSVQITKSNKNIEMDHFNLKITSEIIPCVVKKENCPEESQFDQNLCINNSLKNEKQIEFGTEKLNIKKGKQLVIQHSAVELENVETKDNTASSNKTSINHSKSSTKIKVTSEKNMPSKMILRKRNPKESMKTDDKDSTIKRITDVCEEHLRKRNNHSAISDKFKTSAESDCIKTEKSYIESRPTKKKHNQNSKDKTADVRHTTLVRSNDQSNICDTANKKNYKTKAENDLNEIIPMKKSKRIATRNKIITATVLDVKQQITNPDHIDSTFLNQDIQNSVLSCKGENSTTNLRKRGRQNKEDNHKQPNKRVKNQHFEQLDSNVTNQDSSLVYDSNYMNHSTNRTSDKINITTTSDSLIMECSSSKSSFKDVANSEIKKIDKVFIRNTSKQRRTRLQRKCKDSEVMLSTENTKLDRLSTDSGFEGSTVFNSGDKNGKSNNWSSIPSPQNCKMLVRRQEQVLFTTGLADQHREAKVRKLGCKVVESPQSCTVLVTDRIRRTFKLLCCIGRGTPIVSPDWIEASNNIGKLQDPWKYLIVDKEAENKFSFCLEKSLNLARKKLFLTKHTVHATPSVKPPPSELKGIVESCGGEYFEENMLWPENTIIISCSEDKSLWQKLKKKSKTSIIVTAEAILSGILQQCLDIKSYKLS